MFLTLRLDIAKTKYDGGDALAALPTNVCMRELCLNIF